MPETGAARVMAAGLAAGVWLTASVWAPDWGAARAAPPALPSGLDAPDAQESQETHEDPRGETDGAGAPGPALPPGLERPPDEGPPAVPAGLGDEPVRDRQAARPDRAGPPAWLVQYGGFVEARHGQRVVDDDVQGDLVVSEARMRLEGEAALGPALVRLSGDLLYDDVETDRGVDLRQGEGVADLREAYVSARLGGSVDVKAGRQILTWGVGDLIFINDLFPKDFQSFFIGRDEEYLKAPSDALRASWFTDVANLDVVYTPRFDPDRFLDARRLSFFDPGLGGPRGSSTPLNPAIPNDVFDDDEIAVRVFRTFGPLEAAAYGYRGFFKSPVGAAADGTPIFPALSVAGASARRPLFGGVASAEVGYYRSEDDRDGDDPFIPNSDVRALAGFEREVARDLTISGQYFVQTTLGEGADPAPVALNATRHVTTVRVTKRALAQNLTLSGFVFWSPDDDDGHVRVRATYKATDAWRLEAGANVFFGPDRAAPFAGLQDNTSVFVAVRRSLF